MASAFSTNSGSDSRRLATSWRGAPSKTCKRTAALGKGSIRSSACSRSDFVEARSSAQGQEGRSDHAGRHLGNPAALVLQHHFLIDQQHFAHLRLEGRVAALQVISHLVGAQGLLGQDSLHGRLGCPRQRRMSGRQGLPPHMLSQRLPRPQFRCVTALLGFRAGQMHHPSLGGFRDHRLPGPMVGVFQARRQAHPQGLAHPLGHAAAGHAHLASNRRDGFASMIAPQNLGPLHFTLRRRLRTTQAFELLHFLVSQHQLCTPRFSCHATKHTREAGLCEHLLTKRYTRGPWLFRPSRSTETAHRSWIARRFCRRRC